MKQFVSQSLTSKLIRLTLIAVALALLATVTAVVLFEITTFRPRALDNAKAQVDLVAHIIAPALEFEDERTATKLLEVLRHEQAVESAGVYRANGSKLAQYRRSGETIDPPATSPERPDQIEGRKIIVSGQVSSDGAVLGRVWLQAGMPGWTDRVRQYGPLLVLVALAVVVLSLAISVAMRRQITDPLHALAETVRLVGQSRDLQLRVADKGSGEISELAHSFNNMLETLATNEQELRLREARLARQNQGLVELARAQRDAPEDPAAQMQRLTEILCEAVDVERSGIWLFTADRVGLGCRDLFERGPQKHQAGTVLLTAHYPAYFAALEKERVIAASHALTDPRTSEFNEPYSKPLGLGAMLDVPVRWRGRIAGVLCLEHVGGPRSWQLDEVGFAISAADRVALFLEAEEANLATEELRDSEGRYRNLIEEARDAIFTLSTDGRIIDLNQAVETITGWKRELWIGRNFTDPLIPDDRAKAQALFEAVVNGGRPPSFELQIRSRNGTMKTMEFAISPRYQNRRVVGLLGIGRDVTERKQAGEAQAMLEAQLRQSQKIEAVGNLAGGIAHDFNNILTAIIGNAQLAELEMPGKHPAREYLVQALAASHRAKDLVNQILTFSRRQEQKRTPTSLALTVGESLKLLRSVLPSSIEICPRLPEGLPLIMADVTQLHQIVVNLATNAAHAMEEHGGRLELFVEEVAVDEEMIRQQPQLKPGRFLRLRVADTGTGMDELTLQRIFEPFFTTKETGKGTGLGLAVVHGIVQQHDGMITVYSVPGKGTVFQVYFPIIAGAAAPRGAAAAVPVAPAPTIGGDRRVMVVDDEQLVLRVAEQVLRRAGYQVAAFNDPLQALQAFRSSPGLYDLVVTDLTMPGLKGTKLAAEMRTVRSDIPVLLSTGYGGSLDPEAIQAGGLLGPLQKPFTSESLLEAVAQALDHRRQA